MTDSLVADSIYAQFDDRVILRGVYLHIKVGDVLGLVGLNGCGKTTLMRILFGQLSRFTGVVKISGEYCAPSARWRHIAMLPQNNFLPQGKTVRRAALIFAGDRGVDVLETDDRARDLLSQKINTLSGGQRRWIEFLLVLSLGRTYMLLDEPFSQIEPIYVEQMFARIRNHPECGFLITDHFYRDVLKISSRLVSLSGGDIREIKTDPDTLRKTGYLPPKQSSI